MSHLPRLSPANCEHDARRHIWSLQRAVYMDVAAERARRHVAQLAADNRSIALAIGHEVMAVATPIGHSMTRKAEAGTAYAAGLGVFDVIVLQVSDVDSRRMTLHVANYEVRLVMLSPQLLDLLRAY